MRPAPDVVASKIAQIEAEMKRIGVWQDQPPAPEQMRFERAFGADKLAFEQWLQFVLVPRVKAIVDGGGQFPTGSEVATQAFREWKMWGDRTNVDALLELLREFDALFG